MKLTRLRVPILVDAPSGPGDARSLGRNGSRSPSLEFPTIEFPTIVQRARARLKKNSSYLLGYEIYFLAAHRLRH